MAEFINTADVIGDEEMCDQIIMRTVTEYKENRISKVGQYAFYGCTALETVDVPNVTSIEANTFYNCTALTALILRNTQAVCTLANTNALQNSAIAKGTGYIFVPAGQVTAYKTATNFSTYAEQIRAIEDYTVDGTASGSFQWCTGVTLDRTKVTFDEFRTETLVATMLTPSPYGFDKVKWASADTSIATVSSDGVVMPMGKGTTTITASSNGHTASCEVVATCDILNIIGDVTFNAGYVNNNGTTSNGGSADTYTSRFRIDACAGQTLVIDLFDVKSQASYNRIVYYNESGTVVGYAEGASGTNKVTITTTVPTDAVYAAMSINKSNGFSRIEIVISGGVIIGQIDYTT